MAQKQSDKNDTQKVLNDVFIRAILLGNRLNMDQPEELQIVNCINIAKAIAQTGVITPESLKAVNISEIAEGVNNSVDNKRRQRKEALCN